MYKPLRKLWRDRRAITAQAGIIGTLIGLIVTILIGIVITQNIIASQTQSGWSESANTTWTSLQANIWVAYALLVIVPLIVGAVVILGYVRSMG